MASLSPRTQRMGAFAILAFSTLLVGISIVPAGWISGVVPPFTATFFRFVVAVIFMTILYRLFGSPIPKIPPRDWFYLSLTSLCGNLGFMVFFILAMQYASALQVGLALGLIPVAVTVLSVVFLKEKLGFYGKIAVFFAVIGAMVLKSVNTTDGVGDVLPNDVLPMGIVILMMLIFCEAGWVVFGKCIQTPLDAIQKNFLANGITLCIALPLMAWELQTYDLWATGQQQWLGIVYMGLFATGVSGALWFLGMHYVTANDGGIAMSFIPLFAVLSAVFILDEDWVWTHLVGGIFIFGALGLTLVDGRKT